MNQHLQNYIENGPMPSAKHRKRHRFTSLGAARLFAVLYALLGIACMVFTEQVHRVFPFVLGGLTVATGGCDLYRGIRTKEYQSPGTKLTARGIVMLAVGCVMIASFRNADPIVGAVWGVIGLTKGSEELNLALYQAAQRRPFGGKLLHGGIELLLGVLLLLDPEASVKKHLFLLGIELIAIGIGAVVETKKHGKQT